MPVFFSDADRTDHLGLLAAAAQASGTGCLVGDHPVAANMLADAIEARLRTGRPPAVAEWIDQQEAALQRRLAPRKPGLETIERAIRGNA